MYSDNLVLREVILTGLTTKGSDLTASEVDQNFIYLWQDLKAKAAAGATSLPAYNGSKTYTLGEVVGYVDASWLYVNPVDGAGVEPGSDADYWLSIDLESLAHTKDTDTWLDKYGDNAVSAEEIRDFIDAGLSSPNMSNSDLIFDGDHTHDLDGYTVTYTGGKVQVGTSVGSSSMMEVNGITDAKRAIVALSSGLIAVNGYDATGQGLQGGTVSGIGVYGGASGSGIGGYFTTVTGLALMSIGQTVIEEVETGVYSASALLQINSTTRGVLIPRLTTAQISAIVSPATSLLVFNLTRNRYEFYNGSYWQGIATRYLAIQHTSWSPAGGQTVAFGANPFTPVSAAISPTPMGIVMRGSGVIRGCDFDSYASGVAGSGEAWSLYVRHNGTDYLVQTISSSSAVRKFTNQALNIPYIDGDIVRMVFVNANWVDNPTNVAGGGYLILQ